MPYLSNFVKAHPWFSALLVLMVMLLSLLPLAIKYAAIAVLEARTDQTVHIDNVDLNLFSGHFVVQGLQIEGKAPAQITRLSAQVKMRELLQKRLHFSQIQLKGVRLPIHLGHATEQTGLTIAGIPILPSSSSENTTSPALPFGLGIDLLQLSDIALPIQQGEEQRTYQISNLSLQRLYSWDSDFARLKLTSALNQDKISANLQLHLFSEVPKLVGTLNFKQLELADLAGFLPVQGQGQLNGDLTFTLEQRPNGLALFQYSEIKLQAAQLTLNNQQIAAKQLDWKGYVHYFHGDIQGLKVDGQLNGQELNWAQQTAQTQLALRTSLAAEIHLTGQLNQADAKIQQNGRLQLTELQWRQSATQGLESLHVDSQKLAYQGALTWRFDPKRLDLQGQFAGDGLAVTQQGAHVKQRLHLANRELRYDGQMQWQAEPSTLAVDGTVNLAKLTLEQQLWDAKQKTTVQQIQLAELRYQGKVQQNAAGDWRLQGVLNSQNAQFSQQTSAQQTLNLDSDQLRYQGALAWLPQTQQLKIDGDIKSKQLQLQQNSPDQAQPDAPAKTQQTLKWAQADFKGAHQLQLGETLSVQSRSNLQLTQLTFEQQGATQRNLATALNANLNLKGRFGKAQIELQQKGDLALTQLQFKQADQQASGKGLRWEGEVKLQSDPAKQALQLSGKLQVQDLEVQTADLNLNQSLKAELNLALEQTPQRLSLQQEGALQLSNLDLQHKTLRQQLAIGRYEGKLSFTQQTSANTESSGPIQFNADGRLSLEQAQTELPQQALRLTHNLQGPLRLELKQDRQSRSLTYQGSGRLNQLNLLTEQQRSSLKQLTWQGESNWQQPLNTKEAGQLRGNLALTLEQLRLGRRQADVKHSGLLLEKMHLQQLKLLSTERFTLQGLEVSQLKLQGFDQAKSLPLIDIGGVTLDQAQLSLAPSKTFAFGSINVRDSQAHLTLDENNQLLQLKALLNALGLPSENETPENAAVSVADKASKPHLQLAAFTLSGENRLRFEWQNPQQPLQKKIRFTRLEIRDFDNQAPDKPSQYEVQASIDEFSQLQSRGRFSLAGDTLFVDAKTQIDGLSLNDFSPFVEQAVGYRINSGQLSATINSQIEQERLKIDNRLTLFKFTLSSADQGKTDDFNKNFSVPLEVGVNLLQDKNGNIALEIPIDGDLNNPNFSIEDVVAEALNGALGKATRTYLLLALQPYGAIALAGEFALNQLNAVRLQPVTFEPTIASLSPAMQDYMQKVAELLQGRSNVQIKLCGGSSEQDRAALLENAKKRQGTSDTLPVIQDEQLLAMAALRQSVIKRHLLKLGVNTNQLILCQPSIHPESVAPTVDLGI